MAGYYFIPYRSGYEFSNIFSRILPYYPVNSPLLYPWANFDGVHYLSIAGNGYVTEAVFFPLYPLIVRFVSEVFGARSAFGNVAFFSAFTISNVSIFIGLFLFYKLLLLDYKKDIANSTLVFLLVFPTAFFFGAIYTESVFFLLLVSSFYLARKNMWIWASLVAMLLTSTRLVGIFIFPALLYEYYLQKGMRFEWKNILSLLIAPLGLLSYMLFCLKKWGDLLYFVHAHSQLGNNRSVDKIILFPQTMFRYLKILITLPMVQYEWWISLLEISVFIVVCLLIYQAWKKKVRMSYLLFSFLAFIFPASSGTFIGIPRYALVLFPIFVALALSRSKILKISYILLGIILQFILLMFFSRGYFVS
jgi:hypothetical protein